MDHDDLSLFYGGGSRTRQHGGAALPSPAFQRSRKCGRRDSTEKVRQEGGLSLPASRPLQPPPPLTLLSSGSVVPTPCIAVAGASPASREVSWDTWRSAPSPDGVVSRHGAEGTSAPPSSVCHAGIDEWPPHVHQRREGSRGAESRAALHTSTAALSSQRWKRRRTEWLSFAALRKEVSMYLDAACATQGRREASVTQEAKEDEQGDRDVPVASSPSMIPCPTPAPSFITVDAAVQDTVRVLQSCWAYQGSPHDAFEPVRWLSPITMHLLLSYGHHVLTKDGQYVVLSGGAEQLTWVGCLYSILLLYLSPPCTTGGSCADGGGGSLTSPSCISRVLCLNCHSFGWLDHAGPDEYERSHRQLLEAREAILSLLRDERYAALGCSSSCPLCAASAAGGDAATSVLLGDTIVMEGGVPSLRLARPQETFMAHSHYGRGIACCLPERCIGAAASAAALAASTLEQRSQLCTTHARPPCNATTLVSPHHGAGPSSQVSFAKGYCVKEDSPTVERARCLGASTKWAAQRGCPMRSLSWVGGLKLERMPPVCCGTCRAVGVLGQAVLVGPTGPLLIHLQVEEQEWVEAYNAAVATSTAPHHRFGGNAAPFVVGRASSPPHLAPERAGDPSASHAVALYALLQGQYAPGLSSQRFPIAVGSALSIDLHAPAQRVPQLPVAGGAVSLAEFVEWLVRLLHAPQPALVIEWHVAPPPSPHSPLPEVCSMCLPPRCGNGADGGLLSHAVPTSANRVYVSAPSTAVSRLGKAEADSDEPISPHGSYSSSPAPPQAPPSTPPVTPMLPRCPSILPLLEMYADVLHSRAHSDPSGCGFAAQAWSCADRSCFETGSARTGTPNGAAQEVEVPALVERVQAAREILSPCASTTLFDGVERPFVLAKNLEVVLEAERYLDTGAVVTSLQYRPLEQ